MITSHKHTHLLSGSRGRVWLVLGMTGLLATLGLLIALHGRTKQAAVAVNGESSSVNKSGVQADAQAKARAVEAYGKLPMSFEVNKGQTDARAKFISRGRGYSVFLTANEALLKLKLADKKDESAVLKLTMNGANAEPQIAGLEELPGRSSYFLGNDPAKWQTDVAQYTKVKYQDVYPGIDVVYYGNQNQLEYDFVAAPGADPKVISMAFAGADSLQVAQNGDLVMNVAGREVRQHKPFIYQEAAHGRQQIAGSYVIRGENEVGLEIGTYDVSRPLVIDPVLSYSTLLGGNGLDDATAVTVDNNGFTYITGATDSADFPTTPGAVKIPNPNVNPNPQPNAGPTVGVIFVTKMNPTGTGVVYSAYLGGTIVAATPYPTPTFPIENEGNGIAIDAQGNAYIIGTTLTTNFPTPVTAKSFMRTPGNGPCPVVVKLNTTGTAILFSTYLGGGPEFVPGPNGPVPADILERGAGIAVCEPGMAVVTGYTNSTIFPTTPGAFQTQKAGSALPVPDRYLSADVFVSVLDTNAATDPAALKYSTYVGGGNLAADGNENSHALAVDFSGNIYVTGETSAADFPTTADAFDPTFNGGLARNAGGINSDAFLFKLCPAGKGANDLLYSTFLGGSSDDYATGVAIDLNANAYVAGFTLSNDLPTTANAFDKTKQGLVPGSDPGTVPFDVFVSKISTRTPGAAGLAYSTYLASSGTDRSGSVTVDCAGRVYVTGDVETDDSINETAPFVGFPTTPDAFDSSFNGDIDAFVAILDPSSATGAGSLVYSTYLGDEAEDHGQGIAIDPDGNFYVVGYTGTPGSPPPPPPAPFPTTPGAFKAARTPGDLVSDAFVVKFGANPAGSCNDLRVPSDQKAGSLLFFNLYSSSANNPALENTRINITNTSSDTFTYVHLFFVDGSSCSVADSFVCLTPNQTVTLLASDVDPGVMGYVIAVATDENGCPANFNYLIGDEYVKLASGHEANLGAEAISAYKGCIGCKDGGTTAQLRLNGINYGLVPRVLSLDNIPSQTEGNSTLLVLNRVGGDMTTSGDRIGNIFGLLYDDLENSYSFTQGGLGCQLKQIFNNTTFPRTTPRINTVIPAGHSGWMKLWGVSDIGLLGAMINFNPSANVNAGAFNQGHNLHKLTLTDTAILTIPVFPAHCS